MAYSGKKGTAEPQIGKKGSSAKASTKPSVLSIPADIDKDPVALMQLASKLSLDSGNFVDTKFYAFSRRNASGAIYAPKAIYANSWMLRAKSPQYFENLLFGGYDANCTIGPLDSAISPDHECLDEAESLNYDSDSDIEDDDDDTETASPKAYRKSAPDVPSTKDDKSMPASVKVEPDTEHEDESQVPGQKGQIIVLQSFAYPTWKAFVYYLYTGKVEFSRLKSQKPAVQPLAKTAQMSACAPPCSPKSMYKLADELGISELKILSQADIQSKLSGDNILTELFSTFTSRYDAIRDMEITFACDKAKDALKAGMSSWMNIIPANILKRNATVVGLLVEKLAATPAPAPTPAPAVQKPTYCPSCNRGRDGYTFYLRCCSCSHNFSNSF